MFVGVALFLAASSVFECARVWTEISFDNNETARRYATSGRYILILFLL